MNPSSLQQMTGLTAPKKPTHRGKRSRGKGPKPIHDALNTAMASGDHVAAKSHALNLVKALHALTGPKAPPTEPDADDTRLMGQPL